MWMDRWAVEIIYTHPQFSLVKIIDDNRLWEALGKQKMNFNGSWCALGDFNSVTCREGGCWLTFSTNRCNNFNKLLDTEGLVDVGLASRDFGSLGLGEMTLTPLEEPASIELCAQRASSTFSQVLMFIALSLPTLTIWVFVRLENKNLK